jgi:hypothetical protein
VRDECVGIDRMPWRANQRSELGFYQRDVLVALLNCRNQFGNSAVEGC